MPMDDNLVPEPERIFTYFKPTLLLLLHVIFSISQITLQYAKRKFGFYLGDKVFVYCFSSSNRYVP